MKSFWCFVIDVFFLQIIFWLLIIKEKRNWAKKIMVDFDCEKIMSGTSQRLETFTRIPSLQTIMYSVEQFPLDIVDLVWVWTGSKSTPNMLAQRWYDRIQASRRLRVTVKVRKPTEFCFINQVRATAFLRTPKKISLTLTQIISIIKKNSSTKYLQSDFVYYQNSKLGSILKYKNQCIQLKFKLLKKFNHKFNSI